MMHDDSEFRDLIVRLDALLTGKSLSEAERTALAQQTRLADPIAFVTASSREYQLSDGGYSRLCASEEGELWLTSNSREQVKAAWNSYDVREAAEAGRRTLPMPRIARGFRPHAA